MKFYIILIILVILGDWAVMAQSPKILVKTYESALKQRDAEIIKPYLSGSFKIHVSQFPDSYKMLDHVLKSYNTLNKLKFLKEIKTKKGSEIHIKCFFEKLKNFESVICLDSTGKIERVRYIDQLYNLNSEKESRLVATIPFEFRDKKIMVRMKINDSEKELSMIFDTGADGVGMKQETADAIGLIKTRKQQANVVGGTSEISISSGNTLKFDSLQIKNQNIGIFPNYESKDFDGLFGANFLRNYITFIDFDNQVIKLYNFGSIKYPDGGSIVPLDYKSGLPGIYSMLKLNNGTKVKSKLHFDTGAGYPIILFTPYVKQNDLEKDFQIQSHGSTYSLGHQTATIQGIFDSLQIGNFSVSHFSGTLQTGNVDTNWDIDGDGSLGIDIISKFNCFINLMDSEFYLIPNQSFEKPIDFFLGPIAFGFINDKLLIKQIMPEFSSKTNLKVGDVVVSINDKELSNLSDCNAIIQLEKEYKNGEIELIINRNNLEFQVIIPKL